MNTLTTYSPQIPSLTLLGEGDTPTLTKEEDTFKNLLFANTTCKKIDGRGYQTLRQLSQNPSLLGDLEIRVGYGVSESTEVSVRNASYMLDGLTLLKNCVELIERGDRLPTLTLYSATGFVSYANQLDAEKTRAYSEQRKRYLEEILQKSLPETLRAQVRIEEDLDWERETALPLMIGYLANVLKTNPKAEEIRKNVEKVALRKYPNTREQEEGKEKGFLYTAAHSLYSSDQLPLPRFPLIRNTRPNPKVLIMVGGKGEEVYWKARTFLEANTSLEDFLQYCATVGSTNGPRQMRAQKTFENWTRWKEAIEKKIQEDRGLRMQCITERCEIPPYISSEAIPDLSFQAIETGKFQERYAELRTSLKKDVDALFRSLSCTPETFSTFLP